MSYSIKVKDETGKHLGFLAKEESGQLFCQKRKEAHKLPTREEAQLIVDILKATGPVGFVVELVPNLELVPQEVG